MVGLRPPGNLGQRRARRVLPYPEIRFLMFGRNGFFNRRVLGNPGTEDFFGQPIFVFFVGFLYVRRFVCHIR